MLTNKNQPPSDDEVENDLNIESIPRRQSDRRKKPRRSSSKPQLLSQDAISKLRRVDTDKPLIMRIGDRRQQERRTSRPAMLPIEDVIRLRKK